MPIRPPGSISADIVQWHQVYNPDFPTNIGLGYLEGSTTSLMRATIAPFEKDIEILFDDSQYTDERVQVHSTALAQGYLVSDDPGDTQVFLVSVLAADGTRVRDFVTLNGTTAVPLNGGDPILHVRNMIQISGDLHTGTIYASNEPVGIPDVADIILCRVPPGNGYGASPVNICPTAFTMVFYTRALSCNEPVIFRIYTKFAAASVYSLTYEMSYQPGFHQEPAIPPLVLGQGDQMYVTVEAGNKDKPVSYHMPYLLLEGNIQNRLDEES